MGKAWCSNDSKKALKLAQKLTTEGLILLTKNQDVFDDI